MHFKIYGERNSGVTFLNKLIEMNFQDVVYQTIDNNICSEWQHRIPREKKDNRIDVFIVRDLRKWLISMYNNPYHLNRKSTFNQFLLEKQMSSEKSLFCYDITNNTNNTNNTTNNDNSRELKELNYDDNNKTIFEIRYTKYNDMINFLNNNRNVILVNQSYLLNNENVECFLNKVNELFHLNKTDEWNYIDYNVKTIHKVDNNSSVNRERENNLKEKKYKIDIGKVGNNIINKFKNKSIEDYINNLKFIIKTDDCEYFHK